MPNTLDLLSLVKGRRQAKQIGLAAPYLRGTQQLGERRVAQWLGKTIRELRAETKESGKKFVYHDPGMVVTKSKRLKDGEKSPDAPEDAPKSILDFECILTSKRQDRDGDILEPSGFDIDPQMPLLWQHIPMAPIGRFYKELERTDSYIKIACGIADTPLGRDAATLFEFKALRISHGFEPIEFEPIDPEDEMGLYGLHIIRLKCFEVSGVSIPSNVDSQVTLLSRGKLFHPMVKSYIGSLKNKLPKSVTSGIVVHAMEGSVVTIKAGTSATGEHVSDEDEERNEDEEHDDPKNDPKTNEEEAQEEQEEADDNGSPTEEDEVPIDEEEGDKPEDKVLVGNLISQVHDASKAKDMPPEAANRLKTCGGILGEMKACVASYAQSMVKACRDLDLHGMFGGVKAVHQIVSKHLATLHDELGRVKDHEDLPDGHREAIDGLHGAVGRIKEEMGGMMGEAHEPEETPEEAAETEEPAASEDPPPHDDEVPPTHDETEENEDEEAEEKSDAMEATDDSLPGHDNENEDEKATIAALVADIEGVSEKSADELAAEIEDDGTEALALSILQ